MRNTTLRRLDAKLAHLPTLKPRTVVLLLFVVSLLIRLLFAQQDLFHYESAVVSDAISHSLETDRFHTTKVGLTGFVMINYAVAYIMKLFVTSVDPVQLTIHVSIVIASLLVPLMYVLLRTLVGSKFVAAIGSLLLSFSPQYLLLTSGSDAHGSALFFVVLALLVAFTAEKKDSNSIRALSILFLGFAGLTKPSSFIFVIPILYLVWSGPQKYKALKAVSTFYILFTTLFMVWMLYILDPAAFYFASGFSFRTVLFALQSVVTTLTLPGIILLGYGIYTLKKGRQKQLRMFLTLLFFVPLALHVSSVSFTSRALSFSLIPLFAVVGIGSSALSQKSKTIGYGLIAATLICMIVYSVPLLQYRSTHSHPAKVADMILSNTEENAIVLLQYETTFLPEEVGDREIAIVPSRGELDEIYPIIQHLKNVIFLGKSVYTTTESFQDDVNGTLRRAVLLNFNLRKTASIVTEDVEESSLFSVAQRETLYKLELNEYEDYVQWNAMPYEKYLKEAQVLDSELLPGSIEDYET